VVQDKVRWKRRWPDSVLVSDSIGFEH
jgi:hypothetical protein